MLRFYAAVFITVMRGLAGAEGLLIMIMADGNGSEPFLPNYHLMESQLEEVETEVAKLPVSPLLQRKTRRLRERFATDDTLTVSQAEVLLKELHNDIVENLASAYFLMIPPQRHAFYSQPEPPFGPVVADRFPDAYDDIAAAGRCIALDEWTAAVFHLMRVLEHGLHSFADRLGIATSAGVALENWQKIIDLIEREIRRLDTQHKSQEKSESLQFYSEAASNFRYFKDAWRNHVSHSRVNYSEQQALNIWLHVAQFMQALAGKPGLS
jgi:hypothetical protein